MKLLAQKVGVKEMPSMNKILSRHLMVRLAVS